MVPHDGPPRYGAFLLRCWEVRSHLPGQPSTWRFTLEAAGSGKRRGFRDLEALVAYLARELWGKDSGPTSLPEHKETGE
jgi:hypothetical protein